MATQCKEQCPLCEKLVNCVLIFFPTHQNWYNKYISPIGGHWIHNFVLFGHPSFLLQVLSSDYRLQELQQQQQPPSIIIVASASAEIIIHCGPTSLTKTTITKKKVLRGSKDSFQLLQRMDTGVIIVMMILDFSCVLPAS